MHDMIVIFCVQVHSLIIGDLKSRMPLFIGKDQKKKELINNLEETYLRLQKDFSVPAGTFLVIDIDIEV